MGMTLLELKLLREPQIICLKIFLLLNYNPWHLTFDICIVFVLGTISPCTTGLKALNDPSDCTSTVQLSNY